jgi:hypothetical protein
MFLTTRFAGEPVAMTCTDGGVITLKIMGFRVGDDGRIAATLAFDLPDEVLIDERPRTQGLAHMAAERDRGLGRSGRLRRGTVGEPAGIVPRQAGPLARKTRV